MKQIDDLTVPSLSASEPTKTRTLSVAQQSIGFGPVSAIGGESLDFVYARPLWVVTSTGQRNTLGEVRSSP